MTGWIALVGVAVAIGCGGSQTAPLPPPVIAHTTPPPTTTTTKPPTTPPPDDIDLVPADMPRECVAYREEVELLMRCPGLPKEARGPLRDGFANIVHGWKQLANATPEMRAAISTACQAGVDALAQTRHAICALPPPPPPPTTPPPAPPPS